MHIQFKDIIQCYTKVIEYFAKHQKLFQKLFFNGFQRNWRYSWLYFDYFLNHLPIYEEINSQLSSQRHCNNLNSTLSFSRWKVFRIYAWCIFCLSCFNNYNQFLNEIFLSDFRRGGYTNLNFFNAQVTTLKKKCSGFDNYFSVVKSLFLFCGHVAKNY